jgi:Tfp pilus assembly protein PilX
MIPQPTLRRSPAGDDGIAMVLSLLFMLLLSALGTAMLVLSRSETLSSVNYRMMSQARYGAESGVHKAAHYLLNTYALPNTTGTDLLSNYNMAASPVTYSGQPVVLSALSGVASNYPVAATQAAFAANAVGSLPVGDATVQYSTAATLLSMRQVIPYGSNTPLTVQTWRLTARGTIEGARTAEVEVSAVIERQVVPTFTYGLFATLPGCNALEFGGNVTTDSYDSALYSMSGLPTLIPSGGHVGTNGNLTVGGSTVIKGTLSTPRTGVGDCRDGAVTAYDYQGNATIQGGILKLPQQVKFVDPAGITPLPGTSEITINGSSNCSVATWPAGSLCTMTGAGVPSVTLDPQGTEMALGNVHVVSGATLVLKAGTYNINSVQLTGNAKLRIGITAAPGPVILNIAGVGQTEPFDGESGSVISPTFIASNFRILYKGTGTLKMTGGSVTSGAVYAPNATVRVSGGADYFGAIVAKNIFFGGGAKLHRDKQLDQFFTVGPQMMSVFTWKEY